MRKTRSFLPRGHQPRNGILSVRPVLIAVCIGLAVDMLLLSLFALIISTADISPEAFPTLALIALLVGAVAAGYAASRSVGEKGLLVGTAAGSGLFLLLFLVGLFTGGITAAVLTKLAVMVAGAAVGGILGVNRHKRIRHTF